MKLIHRIPNAIEEHITREKCMVACYKQMSSATDFMHGAQDHRGGKFSTLLIMWLQTNCSDTIQFFGVLDYINSYKLHLIYVTEYMFLTGVCNSYA